MPDSSLRRFARQLIGRTRGTEPEDIQPAADSTPPRATSSPTETVFVQPNTIALAPEAGKSLAIYSEPYAPTGNIGDTGILKLLGAPSVDRLQALIRESVQNSCDAAKLGKGPEISIRLRTLDSEQMNFLATRVLASKPYTAENAPIVRVPAVGDEPVLVLEISDFNTTGLMGPVRADRIPDDERRTDFINFFRNVGAARDTHQGGGTYGFGKVSLYLASECSTIIVDTQTEYRGEPVRRFMGSRISDAFEVKDELGFRRKHTGRHWWGKACNHDDIVDPIEGEEAEFFAKMMGMPDREMHRRGTSIMIVAPRLDDTTPEVFVRNIADQLLEQFWPRMTRDTPDTHKIIASVELEGSGCVISTPENSPQFHLHAQALGLIRKEPSNPAYHVFSNNPRKLLGRLATVKGLNVSGNDRDEFPASSNSIALMRPVGLIVKYQKGRPLPESRTNWAGVFIAADDPEVEAAFADSEPPAHDDWQPRMLPEGNGKKFVSSALRQIKKTAREMEQKQQSITEMLGNKGQSAARLSQALGALMNSDFNTEPRKATGNGRRGRPRRTAKTEKPAFDHIGMSDGRPFAMFVVKVVTARSPCRLIIDTGIVVDGKLDSNTAHREHPEILSVTGADGTTGFPHSGNTFEIPALFDAPIRVQTSLPASATVGLQVRLADRQEKPCL